MRSEAEILLVNFATTNVVRLAEKYTRHGARYLREAGRINLREWRTIVWLERIIEPTFTELAQRVGATEKAFAPLLDGLIERGLIVLHEEEGQETRYSLTEAGDGLFDKVYPVMEKRQRMLVEDEDPDEMALFMDMLHRLEAKVDAAMHEEQAS